MLKLVKLAVLTVAIALPTASYAVTAPPQFQAHGGATAITGQSQETSQFQRGGSAVVNSINARKTISSGVHSDG